MLAQSFYAAAPEEHELDAQDQLQAYMQYLEDRNGKLEVFDRREQRMMKVFDNSPVRAKTFVDSERFNRNYANFRERDVSPEELALLAFVKINAGEAYGVEVVSANRERTWDETSLIDRVEQMTIKEEAFHTRLLLGSTQHFEYLEIKDAWQPTWPLRLLIGALVHVPKSVFHPILLGAEVAGLFAFNWLLNRIQTIFPDDPQVRESMEERLLEVMIDEVGHAAFNRVLVGKMGRVVSRRVSRLIVEGSRVMGKELVALGLDNNEMAKVEDFDFMDLPHEVREKGFFF